MTAALRSCREGGFVARSKTQGLSWEIQGSSNTTPPAAGQLFTGSGGAPGSPTETDFGAAHQGPLFPNGDDEMFVLYFSEFLTTPAEPEKSEVNSRRSMLQLRKVRRTADGWLTSNRSETDFEVSLAPPPDAARGTSSGEAVWSVAKDEASVIALAELNRWHGGWYAHEAEAGNGAASGGCAHKSPVPSDCVTGVYHGFRIGGEHFPFISCDIS